MFGFENSSSTAYGSAAWASKKQRTQAGLYGGRGAFVGFDGERMLRLESDGPGLILGGAGSGKFSSDLAFRILMHAGHTVTVDVKGELSAVSRQNFVRLNKKHYSVNPRRLHGEPHHCVNPWWDFKPDSPRFAADCQLAAVDLLPISGKAGKWWELDGRMLTEKIIKGLALRNGSVSPAEFYDIVIAINGDPAKWIKFAAFMATCGHADVQQAAEWIHKNIIKGGGSREAPAVISYITQHINFLSDPVIARTLGPDPDFALDVLLNENQAYNLSIILPPEEFQTAGALPRMILGAIERLKNRNPSTPTINLYIDECGQLGPNFETLIRLVSFGRGAGLRTWLYWQDLGQIEQLYGQGAVARFWGNAETRIILGGGIRDIHSAKLISETIGQQTLEIDNPVAQEEAKHAGSAAMQAFLDGEDTTQSLLDLRHARWKAKHKEKISRALIMPDELINLPNDKMIVFISGRHLPPILADKYPYYDRPKMAGTYMPNPFHPPLDSVEVRGRVGRKKLRIITERVPRQYAHWPQYQNQTWSYVEGYKP